LEVDIGDIRDNESKEMIGIGKKVYLPFGDQDTVETALYGFHCVGPLFPDIVFAELMDYGLMKEAKELAVLALRILTFLLGFFDYGV